MSRTMKRKFTRSLATREYRKVITIFPEGEKTENCYFSILRALAGNVNVIIKKGDKQTEPKQVLHRAKKYITDNGLSKNEQIWLVVDVDNRPENAFRECMEWEAANHKHNVAISNPNFEYWLLMHFETGDGIKNVSDCMTKLTGRMQSYSKNNISNKDITRETCLTAIYNGEKRHNNTEVFQGNCSTVYNLVKEILEIT